MTRITASSQIKEKLGTMRAPMAYADFVTTPQCSQGYTRECVRSHAHPGQRFALVKFWFRDRPIVVVFPPAWDKEQCLKWVGRDKLLSMWQEFESF